MIHNLASYLQAAIQIVENQIRHECLQADEVDSGLVAGAQVRNRILRRQQQCLTMTSVGRLERRQVREER